MKKVYVDLDDVLVHLSDGIATACGVKLDDAMGAPFDFSLVFNRTADFFGEVNGAWWSSLAPTPWKDAVIDFALSCADCGWDDIHIVTALPWNCGAQAVSNAVLGKSLWVEANLPQLPLGHLNFMRHKGLLAKLDTMIIDDTPHNSRPFGQNGVLVPSRWNDMHQEWHRFNLEPFEWLREKHGALIVARD
jgi:hypothetical protein